VVARTGFFVASLWAPLPLIGMMVGACLWVLLFPATVGFGEAGRDAAGVALIAVPMAYTGIFGAAYFTARGLYALNILSFWTLLAVCAVVSLLAGGLIAAFGYEERRLLILGAAVAVGGFVGLASTALVWWRVASRTPALVPVYEKHRSSRSRPHRSREEATAIVTVEPAPPGAREVVSDELIVRWDSSTRRVQIVHPDRSRYPAPLAEVDDKALSGASAQDAARLIGEPLTRLMPTLRSRYAEPSEADDTRQD
jgi:hypothetical protein